MATQATTTTPIIIAMMLVMGCCAAWMPVLIRESRRPVTARPLATLPRHRTPVTNTRRSPRWRCTPAPWSCRCRRPCPPRTLGRRRRVAITPREGSASRCRNKPGARSENVSTSTSSRAWKHHGRSKKVAKEIAARTVNKERARAGEAATSSRSSTDDLSSGRRGGLRSHHGPGWAHEAAALQRGEAQAREGSLEDVARPSCNAPSIGSRVRDVQRRPRASRLAQRAAVPLRAASSCELAVRRRGAAG